jgi:hypothetical protein
LNEIAARYTNWRYSNAVFSELSTQQLIKDILAFEKQINRLK